MSPHLTGFIIARLSPYPDIDMDKFDRFQLLHRIFKSHRRPIPIGKLSEKLECTERTVKRTIEQMRDYLGAPIDYFPAEKGWQYAGEQSDLFELPGLWLTSDELQSLSLLMHSMESFGKGLLRDELDVIDRQIDRLLQARGIERSSFDRHIKVLPMAAKQVPNRMFMVAGEALLLGNQLEMSYCGYNRQRTRRRVSPQNLVYYRENWYLDAWCHLRNELRTFSLARVERLAVIDEKAVRVSADQLAEHFEQSFGIFAGTVRHTAKLRFNPIIAREISLQQWHPQQQSEWEDDEYLLSLPYSDDRELIQDILRHMPHVYVEAPVKLRRAVQNRLHAGLELYSGKRIRRP